MGGNWKPSAVVVVEGVGSPVVVVAVVVEGVRCWIEGEDMVVIMVGTVSAV